LQGNSHHSFRSEGKKKKGKAAGGPRWGQSEMGNPRAKRSLNPLVGGILTNGIAALGTNVDKYGKENGTKS